MSPPLGAARNQPQHEVPMIRHHAIRQIFPGNVSGGSHATRSNALRSASVRNNEVEPLGVLGAAHNPRQRIVGRLAGNWLRRGHLVPR